MKLLVACVLVFSGIPIGAFLGRRFEEERQRQIAQLCVMLTITATYCMFVASLWGILLTVPLVLALIRMLSSSLGGD